MEGLPTAGLLCRMHNWSEYVSLINHVVSMRFINSIREISWDIRPHHNFGIRETRVCDMPPGTDQVMGSTALVSCSVRTISDEIDDGISQSDDHPMMDQQNEWRATRYGADAQLASRTDFHQKSVLEYTNNPADRLFPLADRFGDVNELAWIRYTPRNSGASAVKDL